MKVSVVMPLYNAAKYLEESICSLQEQSFGDYEIICVNDASTDETVNILKSFQAVDNRIKIFENSERMGAAYSRNKGIMEAKGDYLIFLDGDDVFDKELLLLCYQTAVNKKADIVFFNYLHFDSEHISQIGYAGYGKEYYKKYGTSTFQYITHADPSLLLKLSATCNKFYSADFIKNNNIKYQNLPRQNDVFFALFSLLMCDKVIALNEDRALVKARDHNEPTRISNTADPIYTFKAIIHLLEELKKRNRLSECMPDYYWVFLNFLIAANIQSAHSKKGKEYYSFLQNEGIGVLEKLCDRNKIEVDYYTLVREKCISFSYETTWWGLTEAQWVAYLLREQMASVQQFMETCKTKNMKIVLWGCGEIGSEILNLFNSFGIFLSNVIDKDEKKVNKEVCGYKVTALNAIDLNKCMVVVASRKIHDETLKKKYKNAEFLSIYEILYRCIMNK